MTVHNWNKSHTRILFVAFASLYLSAANADEGVLNLQKSVPYKPGVTIPPDVKLECELPKKLAEYTKSAVENDFATINVVEAPAKDGAGRTLIMQIVGVDAAGGGAYTGKKGMSIEGALWEKGKQIGNFQATRYSGGRRSTFNPYPGTCKMLRYDAQTLGKDVAKWLRKPSMDARLGEAK